MIGLGLIVAAMAASATFASSLNRLVTEPRRFGNNFDMSYDIGADEIPAEVSASLESASEVSGLTYFAKRVGAARLHFRTDGRHAAGRERRPRAGLLRGRLPATADEIAFLGRLTANDLGIDLGDVLALTVGDSTVEFRVTGLIVVPNIGGTDQVGIGAVTTLPGLRMLDASAVPSAALITLAGGTASLPAFVQRVFPQFAVNDFNSRAAPPPSPILNVARVSTHSDRGRHIPGNAGNGDHRQRLVHHDTTAATAVGSAARGRSRQWLDPRHVAVAGDCLRAASEPGRCDARRPRRAGALPSLRRQHRSAERFVDPVPVAGSDHRRHGAHRDRRGDDLRTPRTASTARAGASVGVSALDDPAPIRDGA